jgi:hypothetical protein
MPYVGFAGRLMSVDVSPNAKDFDPIKGSKSLLKSR